MPGCPVLAARPWQRELTVSVLAETFAPTAPT
jgi:hypothetical protein